jgi:hypothetical protein
MYLAGDRGVDRHTPPDVQRYNQIYREQPATTAAKERLVTSITREGCNNPYAC